MKTKGFVLMGFTALFFSFNILFAKILVINIQPFSLAFWRWFFVLLIYLIVYNKKIKEFKLTLKTEWKSFLLLGFLGMFCSGGFVYLGAKHTNANNVALVYTVSPILMSVFGGLFFKEKITKNQITGLILGLIGVLIILLKADPTKIKDFEFNYGDIFVFLAATTWALYVLFLQKMPLKLDANAKFAYITLFGVITLLPTVFIENNIVYPFRSDLILNFSFLVIFPSYLAFRFYAKTQDILGVTTTGLVLYITPLFNAINAFFFLDEQLYYYHIIGGVIIYFGVFVSQKRVKEVKSHS